MINLRTRLVVFAIIAILTTATGIYWYQSLQLDNEDPIDDDDPNGPTISQPNLTTSLELLELTVFRGQSFPAELVLTTDGQITVDNITLELYDPFYNRTGLQIIQISETYNSSFEQRIEINPAFPFGDGAVIAIPDVQYEISFVKVSYNITDVSFSVIQDDIYIVSILDTPILDQAPSLNWDVETNATSITQSGTILNITGQINQTFDLHTTLNSTGYPRILFEDNGVIHDVIVEINNQTQILSDNIIPMGNYQNIIDLRISGKLEANGTLLLNVSIPTKHITLFAVIADDDWDGSSSEAFNFRTPDYYLKQASDRFYRTMNVTILPGVYIPVTTPSSPNLFDFAENTLDEVGSYLGLVNSTWKFGPGSYAENEGFDILLIFTNNTMSNLGIVLGTTGEGAFNMAIHARGSLNSGQYRLPPSFADNLLQHEVSHIFGAPDRFTSDSPPSVMTKSLPSDAIADLFSGAFWLYQTKWLEMDVQTMVNDLILTYWYSLPGML